MVTSKMAVVVLVVVMVVVVVVIVAQRWDLGWVPFTIDNTMYRIQNTE